MSCCHSRAVSFWLFLGRLLFSQIFLFAGFTKIMNFTETAASMAQAGLPMADTLLVGAIVMEFGGGLLILLGWYARFGAFMIFAFIIPVTYVFHSYWGFSGAEMVNNMQHFMKNLAMLGGALYIMACGPGRISVDNFRCRKKHVDKDDE